MSVIADNKYPKGSVIKAKENANVLLQIEAYNQRIYYCSSLKYPEQKHLVYFENELIPTALYQTYFRVTTTRDYVRR